MTLTSGEEWRGTDAGPYKAGDASHASALHTARERIRLDRQHDVTLRLIDRAGRAMPNVRVKVVQTRSEFAFGDQTWELDRMHRFGEWAFDRARSWRQRFAGLFNAATTLCYWTEAPRNDGPKMEDAQGQPRLDGFHACVDWCAAKGMTVKGHPLFWSIDKCTPDWVKRYDVETQMRFAEVRIRNLVASQRGRIAVWDAVNEPLWEAAPKHLAKRHWPHVEAIDTIADYIAPVLKWCRDEDPDATYLVNDYGLEGDFPRGAPKALDGSSVTASRQRTRMLQLVARLRERDASPDAIGLQSHTAGWLSPAEQNAVYDELSAAGLPLHVTEFWPPAYDGPADDASARADYDERVAQYVAGYLTIAFGHPNVDAFFFWGLMEHAVRWRGTHPHISAHELTPLYHRVQKLLHTEWRTELDLTSDGDGIVRFRGFGGDYALRYASNGGTPHGRPFRVEAGQLGVQTLRLLHTAAAS